MTQESNRTSVPIHIPTPITSLPMVPPLSVIPSSPQGLSPLTEALDMDELARLPLEEAVSKMTTYEQLNEFLKHCTGPLIGKMMQAEMDDHLGYRKYEKSGYNTGNSRNGMYRKTLLTGSGQVDIDVPRDRNGDFKPQIVEKFQTRTSEIEARIINMYGLGLTTSDIQKHIRDIYGAEISRDLVSNITDKILPEIQDWQGRMLDSFYPIIYLDAIHFKVRESSRIESKGVYFVLGVNSRGMKEILGFYVGDSESASFWQQVCNNLQNRGVEDVCIACIDGLSGFATAIKNIYPTVEIQRCVIHQIRYSMQYITSRDSKDFMSDLKSIYQASTIEIAEENLSRLEARWGKTYPISVGSWKKNWTELSTYFVYNYDLRKLIYTTNTIEGFHRQIRKVTRSRQVFKTKTALEKVLYLGTRDITGKWDQPVHNWGKILGQLEAFFPGKIEKYLR